MLVPKKVIYSYNGVKDIYGYMNPQHTVTTTSPSEARGVWVGVDEAKRAQRRALRLPNKTHLDLRCFRGPEVATQPQISLVLPTVYERAAFRARTCCTRTFRLMALRSDTILAIPQPSSCRCCNRHFFLCQSHVSRHVSPLKSQKGWYDWTTGGVTRRRMFSGL